MEGSQPKAKGVKCRLVGANGNVFNLIGIVSKELNKAGYVELDKEFKDACFKASSYDAVLQIIMQYVEVT